MLLRLLSGVLLAVLLLLRPSYFRLRGLTGKTRIRRVRALAALLAGLLFMVAGLFGAMQERVIHRQWIAATAHVLTVTPMHGVVNNIERDYAQLTIRYTVRDVVYNAGLKVTTASTLAVGEDFPIWASSADPHRFIDDERTQDDSLQYIFVFAIGFLTACINIFHLHRRPSFRLSDAIDPGPDL